MPIFLPFLLYLGSGASTFQQVKGIDHCLHWHSTALQLLGLWLVHQGLMETAKQFKVPTPWESAFKWIENINREQKAAKNIAMGLSAEVNQSAEVALAVHRAPPPAEVDPIEQLQVGLKQLREEWLRAREHHAEKLRTLEQASERRTGELQRSKPRCTGSPRVASPRVLWGWPGWRLGPFWEASRKTLPVGLSAGGSSCIGLASTTDAGLWAPVGHTSG